MLKLNKVLIITLLGTAVAVSACSTQQIADYTGSTVGFVAKNVVKGTVGAGKLAVKGVKQVASSE